MADKQPQGREGSFREKIRDAKEPEKSFSQRRQKKGNVNSFLRDSEEQADCGSRTAASLEAVSLEQSFLTVGKGIIKDERTQCSAVCILVFICGQRGGDWPLRPVLGRARTVLSPH